MNKKCIYHNIDILKVINYNKSYLTSDVLWKKD